MAAEGHTRTIAMAPSNGVVMELLRANWDLLVCINGQKHVFYVDTRVPPLQYAGSLAEVELLYISRIRPELYVTLPVDRCLRSRDSSGVLWTSGSCAPPFLLPGVSEVLDWW